MPTNKIKIFDDFLTQEENKKISELLEVLQYYNKKNSRFIISTFLNTIEKFKLKEIIYNFSILIFLHLVLSYLAH